MVQINITTSTRIISYQWHEYSVCLTLPLSQLIFKVLEFAHTVDLPINVKGKGKSSEEYLGLRVDKVTGE
jgi:hypothetical protein